MTAAARASPEQERADDGEHGDEVHAGLAAQEVADDRDRQPGADHDGGDGPAPGGRLLVPGPRQGESQEQPTDGEREEEACDESVEAFERAGHASMLTAAVSPRVVPGGPVCAGLAAGRGRSPALTPLGGLRTSRRTASVHLEPAQSEMLVIGVLAANVPPATWSSRARSSLSIGSSSDCGADRLADEVRDERGDATERRGPAPVRLAVHDLVRLPVLRRREAWPALERRATQGTDAGAHQGPSDRAHHRRERDQGRPGTGAPGCRRAIAAVPR